MVPSGAQFVTDSADPWRCGKMSCPKVKEMPNSEWQEGKTITNH